MCIEVNDISYGVRKKKILSNISFTIGKGTIMGLLGPSGSGKTTLIRAIIGAIRPQQGTVLISDHLMPNINNIRRIGYMPQNDAIYNDLSGKDNLYFFGRLYGMKKRTAGKGL